MVFTSSRKKDIVEKPLISNPFVRENESKKNLEAKKSELGVIEKKGLLS